MTLGVDLVGEKTSATTADNTVNQEIADFEGHEIVVVYEEE